MNSGFVVRFRFPFPSGLAHQEILRGLRLWRADGAQARWYCCTVPATWQVLDGCSSFQPTSPMSFPLKQYPGGNMDTSPTDSRRGLLFLFL